MAIDFSQVKEVKYNNQDVTKIERSGVTLWQKVVDPTANFYTLSEFDEGEGMNVLLGDVLSYDNTSSNIHAVGLNLPAWDSKTSLKVHWMIYETMPTIDSSTNLLVCPYKKGSSSTAALSKFSLGSIRANSSGSVSSGSAVEGINFQDGIDLTSYKLTGSYGAIKYSGEFTITPGSSSTYNRKCISLNQLESMYPTAGGSMYYTEVTVKPYQHNLSDKVDFFINNELVKVPANKVCEMQLSIAPNSSSSICNYYTFIVAVEDA